MGSIHIILIRGDRVRRRLTFRRSHFGFLSIGGLVFVVAIVTCGYLLGKSAVPVVPSQQLHALQSQVMSTSASLHKYKLRNQAANNVITARMVRLDTKINRLDAVGAEIAKLAGLKKSLFNFKSRPGEGGPKPATEIPWTRSGLSAATLALSGRVWTEAQQLSTLKTYLVNAKLTSQDIPHGRPVTDGWISSGWGWRPDPFNPSAGKREFHPGIDFASAEGSPIYAIAAGIVTWAGPRYGYGKLVIVNDGNGYSTYYAHAEKVLVSVGEVVKRDARIALVGNTGRSTGPHLFLEVRYKGQPIDPAKYVSSQIGSSVALGSDWTGDSHQNLTHR